MYVKMLCKLYDLMGKIEKEDTHGQKKKKILSGSSFLESLYYFYVGFLQEFF